MKNNKLFDENNINLEEIKKEIRNDALIIYPTDTVYGLAGSIDSIKAINNIYKAKERNFNSPLIALISEFKYIEKIAKIKTENYEKIKKLTEKFWPGALTIILEKKEIIPDIMVSNGNTIGIRIPNLDLSIKIIEACGGILPTTSANISGEPSPKSFSELTNTIKDRVDILVDAGPCKLGEVSTIIDMTTNIPKILRLGAISKNQIEKIIGEVNV